MLADKETKCWYTYLKRVRQNDLETSTIEVLTMQKDIEFKTSFKSVGNKKVITHSLNWIL